MYLFMGNSIFTKPSLAHGHSFMGDTVLLNNIHFDCVKF